MTPDRVIGGCKNDTLNFFDPTCTCNSPKFALAGPRIAKEIVDNRVKSTLTYMLHPWTGPPYDITASYEALCPVTLERLGCDVEHRVLVADPVAGVWKCQCGTTALAFTAASTRVGELLVDKINDAELMELSVFGDPFNLSVEFTLALVLLLGKAGSIVATLVGLPPIIGFLLVGFGMQDILAVGVMKGAGGSGPHPTPAGEMKSKFRDNTPASSTIRRTTVH